MHKVLVNHLGDLSLPRKSVVRLTDRWGFPNEKKNSIDICLFFVLMLYIKFEVPGSIGSLV